MAKKQSGPKQSKEKTREPLIITVEPEETYFPQELINQDKDFTKRNGRPKDYTAKAFSDKFEEYLAWMKKHPYRRVKPFGTGVVSISYEDRPLTIGSFCIFAGINRQTFHNYENNAPEFVDIIARIRQTIHDQKLAGAAMGDYESNLIARDLGIGDKLDVAGTFDPTTKIKLEFGKGSTNAPKK